MQISATLVKGNARINFQENSRVRIPKISHFIFFSVFSFSLEIYAHECKVVSREAVVGIQSSNVTSKSFNRISFIQHLSEY